ncbi:hypothetical protein IEQ34_013887 [Dendrobium chrysotoxum]|uniref:GATA-type domain-containing protein n=1 Tax=Dendrobium chrysotoxum TaxID=161865 RepID=A0AAV7GIE7_DENCH|nr:hypothetical protein IEQ34_013887 [Dendrobium chrysotoxum]
MTRPRFLKRKQQQQRLDGAAAPLLDGGRYSWRSLLPTAQQQQQQGLGDSESSGSTRSDAVTARRDSNSTLQAGQCTRVTRLDASGSSDLMLRRLRATRSGQRALDASGTGRAGSRRGQRLLISAGINSWEEETRSMGKHGPCRHCRVTSTPLWRNGPPEKPVLCNACGSRWRTKGSLANYTPLHAREPIEWEEPKNQTKTTLELLREMLTIVLALDLQSHAQKAVQIFVPSMQVIAQVYTGSTKDDSINVNLMMQCNLTRAARSVPLRFLQASLEVIRATNRPDAIDQALRRPGCFDREIALGVPDENARAEILSVLTRNLRIEGTFYCFRIARFTPGFVGADLVALVSKARNLVMQRIIDKRPQLSKNVDW